MAAKPSVPYLSELGTHPVSNTPNQTPITVQDVIESLDDFLCKARTLPFENDFDLGYERALNDVLHHLLAASPEPDCDCCIECALCNTSRSSTSDRTLNIVEGVVAHAFETFQKVRGGCTLESEFQLGYKGALNKLIDEVRASSRTQELAPNARDDNRETANRRDEDEYYEMIGACIQVLVAEGRLYDTGERRWSERTQSHQVVWGAVPPKHKQH
jgi:hypothetical protein